MFNRLVNFRRKDAFQLRQSANQLSNSYLQPDCLNNGDEGRFRHLVGPGNPFLGQLSYIGNFSKSLKHNWLGEVKPFAYKQMVRGMYHMDPRTFEQTSMMGNLNGINLVNPQGGLAFDLQGADPQSFFLPPAPSMISAEASAEMAELYWMAICRDVRFSDYGTGTGTDVNPGSPTGSFTNDAVQSLNDEFTYFADPNVPGVPITIANLFRGLTLGDLEGHYLSQFLLKPVPYVARSVGQLYRVAIPGIDFGTTFLSWRRMQRGNSDSDSSGFNDLVENAAGVGLLPFRRHLLTLRDVTNYVHNDISYEEYLNAALILLRMPVRLDPGNPYTDMPIPPDTPIQRTQDGFVTLGSPNILHLLAEVASRAQKAVWFQKWAVHRRLRPEAFGGRIQVQLVEAPGRYNRMLDTTEIVQRLTPVGPPPYILHDQLIAQFGTRLLPQSFLEGAPAHPSYGSGHATVAGACVTLLKAWFDESEPFDPAVIPAAIMGVPPGFINSGTINVPSLRSNRIPVRPTTFGFALLPDPPNPRLTVGGELNKLASNISIGRNAAGVHYRSDYWQSLLLGEEVAIRFLREQKLTYNEDFHLSFTRFNGTTMII